MRIYAIIANGEYTDTINGESVTASRLEIVASFFDESKAHQVLSSGTVDVAEPQKWGVRALAVYPIEASA